MKKGCGKCYVEKEMQSMMITVHEWPLPAREVDAMTVVFELACPVVFDMWRSVTFHILIDICLPKVVSPIHPFMRLPSYDALQRYRQRRIEQRMTLAPDAKPFANCHYSRTHIPTSEEHVCVQNGRYFDTVANNWATNVLSHYDCSKLCTFLLLKGPYNGLQRYLAETSHASNEVIAK